MSLEKERSRHHVKVETVCGQLEMFSNSDRGGFRSGDIVSFCCKV